MTATTASSPAVTEILAAQWQEIRQLTYAYLDALQPEQLALRLPFPTSQSLGYQFWCMVGAHESYLHKLEKGAWQGFASSLDQFTEITPAIIKAQMQQADARLSQLLQQIDLNAPLHNGEPGYTVVFQMIKHEMHHHGQLINFLFCHQLAIPPAWQAEWSLRYADTNGDTHA
ncbi:MAG: DinB family protein [Caldilineaceae bacterium]|nr:DinB family protein [Caldilineaceae bacterium]